MFSMHGWKTLKYWLAMVAIAGSVFLLPVENAQAVPSFNFSSSFTPADASRTGMDVGGTWNGSNEISPNNGDTLHFSFQNVGDANPDIDTAYDFDINLSVAAGFLVPTSVLSNPVTLTSLNPGPQCPTLNVNISQSGTGSPVNFAIPNNTNIPQNCGYSFDIELTTDSSVATGANNVSLNVDYNLVNNNPTSRQTSSTSQVVQVNPGILAVTKTAITTSAANGQNVDFTVAITNSGSGGLFDVQFTDTPTAYLSGLNFISFNAYDNTTNNPVTLPGGSYTGTNQYTFDYIPANVRVEIGVRAQASINPTNTSCPDMTNQAYVESLRTSQTSTDFATVDYNLANSLQLTHNLATSYCETCGTGEIHLTVQNTGGISLQDINLQEDLMATGLTFVAGSTQVSVDGGPAVALGAAGNPSISGANLQILNWTSSQISQLAQLDSPYDTSPTHPISIEVIFQVERAPGFNQEGLFTAVRNIQSSATYSIVCNGITQTATGPVTELPIHQPIPQTLKLGRNVDAGQDAGAYTPIVYGNVYDDVIWRVDVQNTGLADMEDLLMQDTIGGNFDINWVCSSEASATNAAGVLSGPTPAGCVSAGGGVVTSVPNFAVDDPFGNPGNDQPGSYVDASAGTDAYIYYVGRIRGYCSNHTNTTDIQWGCEADSPPEGGIIAPATTGGATPGYSNTSSADLSTQVIDGGLTIAQAVTGTNVNQPVGSKGLVTLTITNNTGGTVRNLHLRDILPTQYVMDTTFTPTAVVAPAYGNAYPGMIDGITQNPAPDPDLLNNTQPEFDLTSSTSTVPSGSEPSYDALLRNGDVLTVQFAIVMIEPTYFDHVADLDVAPENTADGTDPVNDNPLTNQVILDFEDICTIAGIGSHQVTNTQNNIPANPEDLDVSISDALFILTNDTGTPLPLNVDLTNNGGHDANDYYLYVSFGQAMQVQTAPNGCTLTSNPPPHPTWNDPAAIPGTLNGDPVSAAAAIYVCNRGTIAPGQTQRFTFDVIKQTNTSAVDDLTFRADVIGEVRLSDGTLLVRPDPPSLPQTSPSQQLGNNYTLDAVRSRVLGFNLTKTDWFCTESGLPEPIVPTASVEATTWPDLNTQIGEDCNYFIETGGWFGFKTPGFTLIQVANVQLTDDLPPGQGFIPFDATNNFDYHHYNDVGSPSAINLDSVTPVSPLDGTDITWIFNSVAGDEIKDKDVFFRVNLKTRLLNDPVDLAYPVPGGYLPNLHALPSTDIARASFDATFESGGTSLNIAVNDSAGIPGYPVEAVRRVDQTITEPNLIITKEVCNETTTGVTGTTCPDFSPAINASDMYAGDTQDFYIYRITITNQASSGGVPRSPAYDVIVTDTLDPSGLMQLVSFDSDGLDNDGDGNFDGGGSPDIDGESVSVTPNTSFVMSYLNSSALKRIDPGASVTLYYRVDPDDAVAPLQTLSNTVRVTYDSLEDDYSNQNPPRIRNDNTSPDSLTGVTSPESGRARVYTAIDTGASIQMLPLQTQPKAVIQVSNPVTTQPLQNVVVGEEMVYQLHAQIPVANLRDFTIRDELPPGISCVEAPDVDLGSSGPNAAAGFNPGNPTSPSPHLFSVSTGEITCNGDVVEWRFGNQELTTASSNDLFDFYVTFVARVENYQSLPGFSSITNEGCNIRNGGSSGTGGVPSPTACSADPTLVRLTYTDENSSTVTLNYAAADVTVREPVVTLTKSFAPVVNADASDELTVTVTATNNGTVPAYNLQILDDLDTTTTHLHYITPQTPGGTDPPDSVTFVGGDTDKPVFNWLPTSPLGYVAPNNTITFTYLVRVDPAVQPHEILDNTIEGRWTSLPSSSTALNSSGSIGADGTELGMRNGRFSTDASTSLNPPNDYFTTATDSVTVPGLSVDKSVQDGGVTPAIGEHKQFQIVIDLPEGVTNGIEVTDNLASTGLSYVLENDATYNVSYSFQGITSINGTALSTLGGSPTPEQYESLFATPTPPATSVPADESTGNVTWYIGTVDTDSDIAPATVSPRIVITYYARINNDANTNTGDQLQNGVTLNYTNGQTGATETLTDNTPAITVVEPQLTVNKLWSNVTPGKNTGDAPDAGDVIEYEVTIDNTGNATAYDINIHDVIPGSISLASSACNGADALAIRNAAVAVTCDTGTTNVTGFVATPTATPTAADLVWGRANGDENLDLAAGDTLTLLYRVTVQNTVEPNQVITNTVYVDWTSLNGASSLERTGAGNTNCQAYAAGATQAYNDYCAGPATATPTVPNTNTATKVHGDDTFTPPVNDGQLRIGDTVQYTVTLTLQEGTTNNIQLVDTLPAGMTFVGVDSADAIFPAVAYDSGANTLTWNIGTYTNPGNNVIADNTFTLTYTAQVIDDAALAHVDTINLDNGLVLGYDDVNGPVTPAPAVSSTITVLQPNIALADIGKVRRSGIVSGSPVITGPSTSGGDVMDFELSACNTGTAPAYDLVLEDALDATGYLNYASIRAPGDAPTAGTAPTVTLNGAAAVLNDDYVYAAPAGPGGTMTFTFNKASNPLMPGQCVVIRYDIDNNAVGINQAWDNSFRVVEYSTLDNSGADADANGASRRTYAAVGPVLFNMNTFAPIEPPQKTFYSIRPPSVPEPVPFRTEATIGELVTYQILVPSAPMTGTLFDVDITDTMSPSLTFVSASLDGSSSYTGALDSTGSSANQVDIKIAQLNGGEQALINVIARVDNNSTAQNTLMAFNNTASYTFADAPGNSTIIGGGDSTDSTNNVSIVEPQLTLESKTVENITPGKASTAAPDAGDILRYTLTINAANGAPFSDAYDVTINDTLGLGLAYTDTPTPASAPSLAYADNFNAPSAYPGNTLAVPHTNGADGVSAQQVLTWSTAYGSNIDIGEGDSITVTYDVVVLDSVLASQSLSNSASITWTSLDGADINERDGSGGVNDYVSGPQTATVTTDNNNIIAKSRASDTYNAADDNLRVGDIVTYQLDLHLQEGSHPSLVVQDSLPQGMKFKNIVSINNDNDGTDGYSPDSGLPFTYTSVPASNISTSGDPAAGPSTLSIDMGDVTNVGVNDNDTTNDVLTIVYTAQVMNNDVLAQINNTPLQNSATYSHTIGSGTASVTASTYTVNVQQPNLSVAKTATEQFGDSEVIAGENITYTVTITNNGTAPAYDTVLRDTLPFGMRLTAPTTVSIETPVGTSLATFAPTYDSNTGIAEWNFDSGVADAYTIQPGQSLRLVYTAVVDATVGAGLTMTNSAQVQNYYSFDNQAVPAGAVVSDREVYGPSNTDTVTLTTPAPTPLSKQNPTPATAAIGVPFSYTITVPSAPQATALYDVRILDDISNLPPSGEHLVFVDVQKVSGSGTWVPVNTGTTTNLVIEDTDHGGIDIPAGEQAVIQVTVVVQNTNDNGDGDTFTNSASYTFNTVDGDNGTQGIGGGDTTPPMTVIEPLSMVLQKTGPATINFGTPGTFNIDVHNTGNASAYDLTVTDHLPDPSPGGMCDVPPTNFTAEIQDNLGNTQRTLTAGTDFSTSFTPSTTLTGVTDPTCTLTMTMASAAAGIESNWHLVLGYDASLDLDNANASTLTNYAAATQWFSGDTPAGVRVGEIRQYDKTFDPVLPGTPGTSDYQDLYTTTVASPELVIQKTVVNTATGQPAVTAEPGDTLTYTINISNIGPAAASNFSLTDEPDRLNPAPGYFTANTMANANVSVPATVTLDPTGGAQGTGLLSVSGLNLASGANLSISFDITLGSVITSGTIVTNQAQVALTGFSGLVSDDPSIPGNDNPTQTIIGSVPVFQVEKTSTDITGDANVLARGDVLRYTITAKNIGAENSINTLLRDQIPAHTTYVTNSTTLNGVAVPDASGISPLQNGMLINAPENATAGFMRADSTASVSSNVATVTFDVMVDSNVINGTVISNQGFVTGAGAGSGPFAEQPSDNPATTDIPNDPTVDIVGNLPIVDAQKTVSIVTDNGTPNVVDVGDVLEYRIVVTNAGTIPATGVVLVDDIHGIDTNSDYVPNSITLNGVAVPDSSDVRPGNGQLLTIDLNSSDLANPDQTQSNGQLSPGGSAVVTFRVTATDADAASSIIANQGQVQSNELPAEPTDADGNDENGDQPTTINIGLDSQMAVSKDVFVVGGGVATAGGQLEYVIRATNTGSVDATNIAFTDVMPAGVTYVPGSARLNGSSAFNLYITEPGASLDVDVQSALGPIEPGDSFTVTYRVTIDNTLTPGTTITNSASVSWTENPNPASASISLDVGGAPGVANLNGRVWHDADHGKDFDSGERPLAGWSVDIYLNGQLLDTVLTDANGVFAADGLAPSAGATGNEYELRFRAPGAGANTAALGMASSSFSPGLQRISNISVAAGANILDQNLPIEPDGVVYNAVTRTGVAGAQLQLQHQTGLDANGNAVYENVSSLCFDDPAQQDQITLASGYYKFDLNFSQASCPPDGDFFIHVNGLPTGYLGSVSQIIPPRNNVNDPAFDVPACPSDNTVDAVDTTPDYCEIQASELAPTAAPRTAATDYYLKFTGNGSVPDINNQFYNNHIPLDPELNAALSVSKTAALVNVTRSQLVPYTITINNTLAAPVYDVDVIDTYPAGFKYVQGSARIYVNDTRITAPLSDASRNLNFQTIEPQMLGRQLTWPNMIVNTGDTITIKMLLVVGAGVGEGEYVNRVQALNNRTGQNASGEASATVRVVPDPTFDCSDVIGKVFDDANLNGYQDEGEKGIAGARVVSARGLEVTADKHGRFHITCAIVPNPDRGSNFILKLDERSLPSGYRVTTENPRVERATRGKMLKFNFGAAIHRVVRLDLADAVFEPKSTELRPQWKPRLDLLITELAKDPSVLRLSYLADVDDPNLVDKRIAAIKKEISRRWQDLNCCYKLMIESEVFWRTGGPPDKGELK